MSNTPTVLLPTRDGRTETYALHEAVTFIPPAQPASSRVCFAAPHVVVDALSEYTPGRTPPVDWDATMAFRRHLWKWGIGVAEAMDTSERGPNGLSWPQAKRLISDSLEESRKAGGRIVCGAGTEQISGEVLSLEAIVEAYLEQLEHIESEGGAAVIRASHQLTQVARSTEDYLHVYSAVVSRATRPVIVHWLGKVFDPSLEGYWGERDEWKALEAVLELAASHASRMEGVKFSLLNPELEIELRRSLPAPMKVYTGDDYDYPRLLLGDGQHHSHGLLGVFDPLAPIAGHALRLLEDGDEAGFLATMESTVPLAVEMFEPPASDYKTGVVFVAYLSGHQDHFRMVSGREGMRSALHLASLFRLTDQLGLFPDPSLAAHRMRVVMDLAGVS